MRRPRRLVSQGEAVPPAPAGSDPPRCHRCGLKAGEGTWLGGQSWVVFASFQNSFKNENNGWRVSQPASSEGYALANVQAAEGCSGSEKSPGSPSAALLPPPVSRGYARSAGSTPTKRYLEGGEPRRLPGGPRQLRTKAVTPLEHQ